MRSIPSGRGFSVSSQMLTVVKDSSLLLNLDAGDTNSYSGSGTTWTDRSTQAGSVTLTNGPSYNTTKSPNILFDGVDDYAVDGGNSAIKAISNGGSYTIDAWMQLNSLTTSQYLCGNQNATVGSYGFGLVLLPQSNIVRFFYTSATSLNGVNVGPITFNTTWMHLNASFQYNDGSSPAQSVYSLYINSVQQATSTNSQPTGTLANSANSFYIGRRPNATLPASMNLATFKLYNRVLSSTEVTQNYNAGRGRFGL